MIGSVACALAPDHGDAGAARGLQGFGGGGLISLAQTIIGDIMSPQASARATRSSSRACSSLASLAGPLLGGFLAQHLHWSLIFWINLPIGVAAFLMTNAQLKRLPRHERPHRLGLLRAPSSLVLAVDRPAAGPELGRRPLYLGSPRSWRCSPSRSCSGPCSSCASPRRAEPLIPLSVLGDRVVYSATLAACFAMGTFIGLTIYVPIFLEGVLG